MEGEIFNLLFSTKTLFSLQLFISGYSLCTLKGTNPDFTFFLELFYPCRLFRYISEALLLLPSLSGCTWLSYLTQVYSWDPVKFHFMLGGGTDGPMWIHFSFSFSQPLSTLEWRTLTSSLVNPSNKNSPLVECAKILFFS